MAKTFKKILALAMAIVLCMGLFSTTALAAWNGASLSVEITKGENGYTFQSVYEKPYHAYEMSGHMVSPGSGNDIPQTLVLVPADRNYTWSPSGLYTPNANYEALYCCDADTGYVSGVHYKRMNLEDSDYYTDAAADKIRAIVSISYPFRTLDEMKATLKARGLKDADKLTRGEIISGVQAAIWFYANNIKYSYSQSFTVADNTQWGGVMHDYGTEGYADASWWKSGKRVFSQNKEVGARVDALRDFLISLPGVDAKAGQIVITNLDIVSATPVQNSADTYIVSLNVTLNQKANKKKDNVALTISVNGNPIVVRNDFNGTDFKVNVEAKNGDTIEAVISGTQMLDTGVYFYEPEGGRGTSQCLVGVSRGATEIYAAESVTLNMPETPEETPDDPEFRFPEGGASNISYMLVKDGKAEFVKKIDLQDGDTSAPIIMKEGYVSAMFIKQSTSGLLWFSEEVDEETVQNTIKCLIANNPSYKGMDENVAYGFGVHNLTYAKKNGKLHTIPYTFAE